MKMLARLACFYVALFPVFLSGPARADVANIPYYGHGLDRYPRVASTGSLEVGGRVFSHAGSERAEEYGELQDGPALSGSAALYPFPHRIRIDGEFLDDSNFIDLRYGLSDVVLLRWTHSALNHNLPTINLVDLDTETTSPGVINNNPATAYGLSFQHDRFALRLKPHSYHAHFFLLGDIVKTGGLVQQRSLGGSGFFNALTRTVEPRKADGATTTLTMGANSHLGPLEAEFTHREKRYRQDGDALLVRFYETAETEKEIIRAGGRYPYNTDPETRGRSNELRLHSSYTGRIVVSGTLRTAHRENLAGGASADTVTGSGALTWIPSHRMALFAKIRHRSRDTRAPETVFVPDLADPANGYGDDQVRQPVDMRDTTVSLTTRLRAAPGVVLRGRYEHRNRIRTNEEAWHLPRSTKRHTLELSADVRLARGLRSRVRYNRQSYNDPAYNVEPDRSHHTRATLTWTPSARINFFAGYDRLRGSRQELRFVDPDGPVEGPESRKTAGDRITGSLTIALREDLTAGLTYLNYRNRIRQDIVYHSAEPPFPALVDPGVYYRDRANHHGLHLSYTPDAPFGLSVSIDYTLSKGLFSPESTDLLEPVSVADFSRLAVEEYGCNATAFYDLRHDLRMTIEYRFRTFHDLNDRPDDAVGDSTVNMVWVKFRRTWN